MRKMKQVKSRLFSVLLTGLLVVAILCLSHGISSAAPAIAMTQQEQEEIGREVTAWVTSHFDDYLGNGVLEAVHNKSDIIMSDELREYLDLKLTAIQLSKQFTGVNRRTTNVALGSADYHESDGAITFLFYLTEKYGYGDEATANTEMGERLYLTVRKDNGGALVLIDYVGSSSIDECCLWSDDGSLPSSYDPERWSPPQALMTLERAREYVS